MIGARAVVRERLTPMVSSRILPLVVCFAILYQPCLMQNVTSSTTESIEISSTPNTNISHISDPIEIPTSALTGVVSNATEEVEIVGREEEDDNHDDMEVGESRAEARQLRFPNFPPVSGHRPNQIQRPNRRPPFEIENALRRQREEILNSDYDEDQIRWPNELPPPPIRSGPRKNLRRLDPTLNYKNTIVSRRPPRPPSGIYRPNEEEFAADINIDPPLRRQKLRPSPMDLDQDIIPVRMRPHDQDQEGNRPRFVRPNFEELPVQGYRNRNPDIEVEEEDIPRPTRTSPTSQGLGKHGPRGESSDMGGLLYRVPPPYQSLAQWESQKTDYAGEESPFSFPYSTKSTSPPRLPPPIPPSTEPPTSTRNSRNRDGKYRRGYYPTASERPIVRRYSPRPLIPYRPTVATPRGKSEEEEEDGVQGDSQYRRSSSNLGSTQQNAKRVNLNTEYFSIPAVVTRSTLPFQSSFTTFRPSRVPVLVKKLAKRPIIKPTESPDRAPITIATSKPFQRNSTDLCDDNGIVCEVEDVEDGQLPTNGTVQALTDILRGEIWVIPIVVASLVLVGILLIFEAYLVIKSIRSNPSRRHLFLGQMLMLGLLTCCAMAICLGIKPTDVTCAVMRIGIGVSYSIIYSTLLVKLVFLISLNSGVYLPATYQCLLLCFAILIQIVIGVQWLVSTPAEVISFAIKPEGELYFTCAVTFEQQITGLLYVIFLVLVVVILAFKSRGVRENYREAMYIGLTMGFTVCIFTLWILAGFITPSQYKDVCMASGLMASAAITFIIMFMPKGRQLSAMGQEGIYAEDRVDVYTGSSTQSTGSGGTPSPSFFPIKPGKLAGHLRENRERLDTPPQQRKNALPPRPRGNGRHGHDDDHGHRHHHNIHHHQQHGGHQHSLRRPHPPHGSHSIESEPSQDSLANLVGTEHPRSSFQATESSPRGARWRSRSNPASNFTNRDWRDLSFHQFHQHPRDRSPPAVAPRNFHSSFHDLHTANEMRASRADLRELRDLLRTGSGLTREQTMRTSRRSLHDNKWGPPTPPPQPCRRCSEGVPHAGMMRF
ncbi:uncharacterized protein LOC131887207 isoform X1 [Tigriopus californicus]|uniref:uncharacterized protein LOC131887207 isoform X1 n=1 Tax=Tigriopus californicus TaxID=6832 RepID=UPI0027DA7E1D|nr:uncharacterized protein LOC131887207 isoform X1 [Tigriopus californicus]